MSDPISRLNAALEGRYRIERELGEGGMATVYLADDLKHERKVALKVLKPELAAVVGADRFLAEIKTTANLQHPNILPLFDSGEADSFVFYVMPYVEGESLQEKLGREHQLPVDEAIRIATEVADALQAAHEQGVIHRDIKPANILLSRGRPLVADFGIALAVSAAGGTRLTETGLSLGTPHYMSPEQATGDQSVGLATDIYALGCVLYEMLVGEPPFTGSTPQAVLGKIIAGEPESVTGQRRSVPANADAAIAKALEKLPADRFRSVANFAEALANPSFRVASQQPATRRTVRPWIPITTAVVGLIVGYLIGGGARSESGASLPLREVRLTHSGQVGCAAISSDGRQFASIVGSYNDETLCSGTLVLQTVPNGAPLPLVSDVRNTGRIAWSPDGTSLLFEGDVGSDRSGIFVVSSSGGRPRLVSDRQRMFGFFEEGSVFVVVRSAVRIHDLLSGEVTDSLALPAGMALGDIQWSDQLKRFAFSTPSGSIVIADRAFQVLDSVVGVSAGRVSWLGTTGIAYSVVEGFAPAPVAVIEVGAGGQFVGEAQLVRRGVGDIKGLSAAADGLRLLAVSAQITDVSHAFLLNDAADPHALVPSLGNYVGDPAISPDGAWVSYYRNDAAGLNAYLIGFDGGPEVPLTNTFERNRSQANWTGTPDEIMLWGGGVPGALFDRASGRIRPLGSATVGLAFVRGLANGEFLWLGRRGYVATDREGSEIRRYETPDWVVSGVSRLAPGFEANTVLHAVSRSESEATGQRLIYRFSPDPEEWQQLLDLGPGPEFSPLGEDARSYVYYAVDGERTEVWRARPDGGAPSLVSTLPFHCYLGGISMTRAADRLVCNVTSSDPDAWLLEFSPATPS